MMGYMGFGMQQWIYSRNPKKKLYERRDLRPFKSLHYYSRIFKLQPRKPENNRYGGFLVVLIIFGFIIMASFTYINFTGYSNNHNKLIFQNETIENRKAFNFLINSGKKRLQNNNTSGAYSEFRLAKAIYPKNDEVNQLLIETLSILCNTSDDHCQEMDELLSSNF